MRRASGHRATADPLGLTADSERGMAWTKNYHVRKCIGLVSAQSLTMLLAMSSFMISLVPA